MNNGEPIYAIETKNLSYHFSGTEQVLHHIDLHVPMGSVYGFLGPNGAGKTTTLRLLLGLIKKQHGEVLFFNKKFESNRIDILKQTGSLIESPSLYGHLTATENLKIWQTVFSCSTERISSVLQLVGLSETGSKKVSKFSLGMKQRLSIAIALLHSPTLLILDEPSNGLDPSGIMEMRELLLKINKELGITILISSHLLSEIEKMVSHVGIINKGKLLFEGTMQELQQKQSQGTKIVFETSDALKTISILTETGIEAEINNNQVSVAMLDKEMVAGINEKLIVAGIKVYRIYVIKNDLESIFMDLTK